MVPGIVFNLNDRIKELEKLVEARDQKLIECAGEMQKCERHLDGYLGLLEIWRAIAEVLDAVSPGWRDDDTKPGIECAVAAIRKLAVNGTEVSIIKGQAAAWMTVTKVLDEVDPDWHKGHGSALSTACDCIRKLAEAANPEEKKSRVYYQALTYDVCRRLDKALGRSVVCGTHLFPSNGVQEALDELIDKTPPEPIVAIDIAGKPINVGDEVVRVVWPTSRLKRGERHTVREVFDESNIAVGVQDEDGGDRWNAGWFRVVERSNDATLTAEWLVSPGKAA